MLCPQEWKGVALDQSVDAVTAGIHFAEELEIAVSLAEVSIPPDAVPLEKGHDKWRENLLRLAFTSLLGSTQGSRNPADEDTDSTILNGARPGLSQQIRDWYNIYRWNLKHS